MEQRKIIHVDMDAFYASVEQRDNIELRGKPIAVGSNRQRGVVAAASYEARVYGVHSAMPSTTAIRKCPNLVFVKPDFEKYKRVSKQIREIFHLYTDLVEPLSLDEAYLDVTENLVGIPSASIIAKEIKAKIKVNTGLTASAGVSYNKFLAKIASDYKKPDGFFLIEPENAIDFLRTLDVKKFHGIGKVTAQKMNNIGISKGADLEKYNEIELIKMFGKPGSFYYGIVRGIDNRRVNATRERKSVGAEITFPVDLINQKEIIIKLHEVAKRLFERIEKAKLYGKTITVKIKFHDFQQVTRSKTLPKPISNYEEILQLSKQLVLSDTIIGKPIRLLGISISNFLSPEKLQNQQLQINFND